MSRKVDFQRSKGFASVVPTTRCENSRLPFRRPFFIDYYGRRSDEKNLDAVVGCLLKRVLYL